MTSKESKNAQDLSVDLINDNPWHLKRDWAMLTKHHKQSSLIDWSNNKTKIKTIEYLDMPRSINWTKMKEFYNFQPKGYEELISMRGVGPNTIRALALISELIYGENPSWRDPVKYSFTVGGKDGVPFPVDRKAMDESTEIIRQGIQQAKIGNKEKLNSFKRLQNFISQRHNLT